MGRIVRGYLLMTALIAFMFSVIGLRDDVPLPVNPAVDLLTFAVYFVAFTLLVIWPFSIHICLSERWRLRAIGIHLLGGGAAALVLFLAIFAPEIREAMRGLGRSGTVEHLVTVCTLDVVSGTFGAFGYWLAAGRFAGETADETRERRRLARRRDDPAPGERSDTPDR